MMTISKAYAKLEADGVVERVRGTGMRVLTPSPSCDLANRKEELTPLVEQAVIRARQLGLGDEQILEILHSVLKEHQS